MKRWNWSDIAGFLAEFMRVLFWGCVCEWILHHFYFNALQHNEALLHTMPLWALAGCGYSLVSALKDYRQISKFSGTKSQNLNVSHLISQVYKFVQ